MNQKRQYKTYTKAFKEEAVALVIDQGLAEISLSPINRISTKLAWSINSATKLRHKSKNISFQVVLAITVLYQSA